METITHISKFDDDSYLVAVNNKVVHFTTNRAGKVIDMYIVYDGEFKTSEKCGAAAGDVVQSERR